MPWNSRVNGFPPCRHMNPVDEPSTSLGVWWSWIGIAEISGRGTNVDANVCSVSHVKWWVYMPTLLD